MLGQQRQGTVSLAKWLEDLGISRDLQKRYRKNGWLEAIGPGAYKRTGDTVTWQGGLYAIQQQAKLPVHAGGLTALSMQGLSHYFRMSAETVFVFSTPEALMPRWFIKHPWGHPVQRIKTSFLPKGLGLTVHEEKDFSIRISAPERAIMECLYLVPRKMDLSECLHVMEGLSNLRPNVVQELLEACTSVKVKRLFLFLAKKAQHQWLTFIDQKKVSLGKGDRSITKGGVYDSEFHIVIPKELA